MDAALAALDRGVRALFAEPGAALAASSAHPLCECILLHPPPPDWRYLQRFPVLKRHVLTQFRLVALEVEKQPQTPRKRKKRSLLQQSGNVEDFRAVCLASLCQKLAPCGLLTLGDAEFDETLVNMEALDVLRRVVGGRLLPLRLRMLLLGFALQRAEKTTLDAAAQSWIQELCEKILEEAREATATGGSKEPPSKRVRTRSGDKKDVGAEKEEEKLCGFCRDGAIAESLRSKSGGWEFLVECTHRVANLLEKSGESYASNEAMGALSTFWDSLPVAGLASGRSGRRRKRAEISVTCEDRGEPSLSLVDYERIVHVVVGSAAGVSSASGELNTFQVMWKNVWEREFMSMANEKQITLADAIRHCSKADAFASVVLLQQKAVACPESLFLSTQAHRLQNASCAHI
ncbi:hypothetical protein PR003_g368 [Phytophthora rubi]|uniref:Uncharacterized protein n=1 Tax=Phytophthora rubi TaxID=129364 RepID=A0A6A4G8D0_9STRA|nr:hypothetical protein PR003_g368 [Phytophthora rubi]